jgi:hypothetical protein
MTVTRPGTNPVVASLATVPFVVGPWLLLAPNAVVWLAVAVATPALDLTVIEDRPEPEWTDRIARLNAAQGYGWVGGPLARARWVSAVAVSVGYAATFLAAFGVLALGAATTLLAWRRR